MVFKRVLVQMRMLEERVAHQEGRIQALEAILAGGWAGQTALRRGRPPMSAEERERRRAAGLKAVETRRRNDRERAAKESRDRALPFANGYMDSEVDRGG
jgi:hypothetical protein